VRRIFATVAFVTLAVVLAACADGDADPTPPPAPTAATPPMLPAGALTVGELFTRIEAAWPTVRSMRTTFWTTTTDAGGTPPSTGTVTIEEAVRPNGRRVVILNDGGPTDEQVAVDGRVYMRGAVVPAAIAPMVDSQTWVEIDPAAAGSNSPIAMQIAYLLSLIESPFADLSPETAALEAVSGSEVTIGGRTCQVFTFGDPAGVMHELAIGADGRPCRLVQRAGGVSNVTLYEFDVPDLTIAAPEVATPVGGDAGS